MKKKFLYVICFFSFTIILNSCNPQPSEQNDNGVQAIATAASNTIYVCPPCNSDCDKLEFDKAGTCPHCKMTLVVKKDMDNNTIPKKKKIAFYLQSGVEVLDFAGPMEVFAYSGHEVFTVSKTKDPIISQGILKIIPDYSIDDAPQADILAFFGGNGAGAAKDKAVTDWVRKQKDIEYYFSVCTGAFILGEAGILKGKTATTFHNALDNLEKDFPETKVLKDVRFVDNGNVITTAGISAGIDGALHLVARMDGFNEARKGAYYMEYDKWIPAEGLLLTEEDPYKGFTDIENLEDYVGNYEFRNGGQIEIKINDRENSLFAIVEKQNYPLFFFENDNFKTVGGDQVMFKRNEKEEVIGYSSTREVDLFFAKL